jgi:lipoprotein NlpD
MADRLSRWIYPGLVICGIVLGACAPMRLDYESSTHVVRRGETLYAIAWQHGVDYRQLARWNSLSNPNLIYPGQRLRVRAPASVATSASRPARQPEQQVRSRAPAVLPQPSWIWPTTGQIAARFGSDDGIGSGIAVAGANGQAVQAAASGRIVYVGTGLAGYGQLVIVQHNDAWLSAYGHTERVLVEQGDTVERGQRIASMGLGPRRQPRLHFEIRRNGEPVDPLPLLPARRQDRRGD